MRPRRLCDANPGSRQTPWQAQSPVRWKRFSALPGAGWPRACAARRFNTLPWLGVECVGQRSGGGEPIGSGGSGRTEVDIDHGSRVSCEEVPAATATRPISSSNSLSGFGGRGESSTARGQFFDDLQANNGRSAKNRRMVDRTDGFAARPAKVRQAAGSSPASCWHCCVTPVAPKLSREGPMKKRHPRGSPHPCRGPCGWRPGGR